MASFKDCEGRLWDVRVNVETLRRVISLVKVDLLSIIEGDLAVELCDNPVKLCDILFAVCKPEADKRGVTDQDFGRAMAGDSIGDATAALLGEVADFSPSPRQRAILRRVVQAAMEAEARGHDLAEKRLASGILERVADAVIAKAIKEADEKVAELLGTAGKSSGSVPESSG